MSEINYKEYINSLAWKAKRMVMLAGDHVQCECCKAKKWMYCIWKCNACGSKFYGDKWNTVPYCECGFYEESGFTKITDGREYFQLHHIDYKNLGDEKDDDLVILCQDCHGLAHTLIKLCQGLDKKNVIEYIRNEKNLTPSPGSAE